MEKQVVVCQNCQKTIIFGEEDLYLYREPYFDWHTLSMVYFLRVKQRFLDNKYPYLWVTCPHCENQIVVWRKFSLCFVLSKVFCKNQSVLWKVNDRLIEKEAEESYERLCANCKTTNLLVPEKIITENDRKYFCCFFCQSKQNF
ncbi:MAG: hypothetical protein WCT18_03475 [Patescibacteria group bacterium]